MAGGTFIQANKKLPGAYINFESVTQAAGTIGERGVATMPLQLEWGLQDTVIELLSTDLSNGHALAKVGLNVEDEEALLLRECLKHCYKLLLWRADKGAVKATAAIGDLTVSAKYAGLKGNHIKVAIIPNQEQFDVVTYYKLTEKTVKP